MTKKQDIIDLETRFWQSMVDGDIDASIALMPKESVVTGAQGVAVLKHADYRAMAKDSERLWKLKSFAFKDVKVIFPTEDVAVIAYTVTGEMDVEGKPTKLDAADATTWIKTDGEWLAALHTESLLGDAFGRDRKAA